LNCNSKKCCHDSILFLVDRRRSKPVYYLVKLAKEDGYTRLFDAEYEFIPGVSFSSLKDYPEAPRLIRIFV